MSTTKLNIEHGQITDSMGRYFDSLSDDKKVYKGNGWTVKVQENRILAECEREYSDGIHRIHATVTQNKINTVISIDGKTVSQKNTRCNYNYNGNGTLGLAGGKVDERYVYWRDTGFCEFLEKNDLTAKEKLRLSSDGKFHGVAYQGWNGGEIGNTKIYTDGVISVTNCDTGNTEKWAAWGYSTYERWYSYEIENASVIIVKSKSNRHACAKILYSNINDLTVLQSKIESLKEVDLGAVYLNL